MPLPSHLNPPPPHLTGAGNLYTCSKDVVYKSQEFDRCRILGRGRTFLPPSLVKSSDKSFHTPGSHTKIHTKRERFPTLDTNDVTLSS